MTVMMDERPVNLMVPRGAALTVKGTIIIIVYRILYNHTYQI